MEPVETAAGTLQLRPRPAYDLDVLTEALADPEIDRPLDVGPAIPTP